MTMTQSSAQNTKHKQNASSKKFKQTRELIRLALNDGMTQDEIAKLCRTQQSKVSLWSKGAQSAKEHEVIPLLKIYGHKLRRKTFKVYWSIDEQNIKHFYKVEGKVIFSQAFCDARRDGPKLIRKIPTVKLIIQHQGQDQFIYIYQSRFTFKTNNCELENSLADAVWSSSISACMDGITLLAKIDQIAETLMKDFPSDALTLPFLIRQSLLQHGCHVEGIVEYPAAW